MNALTQNTFVAFLIAVAFGCQGQEFSSQSRNQKIEKAPAAGTEKTGKPAITPPAPHSQIEQDQPLTFLEASKILEEGGLSDDDNKILGCIEEWGSVGLSKEALKGYRKLSTTSEGFASGTIKDTKTTPEPRLVLVKASSTGFAGAHIELLNPKGWYCIDVANVGFSSATILMHCEAEEAGMNQKNTGFSSTQITKVGC